jgi:urea ABC transporter ATP-binding protein UrtE
VLRVTGLSGGYHGSAVLREISLEVEPGAVVAVLGRNGMGKTSLLKAVMGLLPWARGTIQVSGHEISSLPTHQRVRSGIGYVPQGRGIFPRATVEQNLRYGFVVAGRPMRSALPERVLELFPWIREHLRQPAGTLSGGEQQMLAIARALVADPPLLLLDEPTEGLAPAVVEHLHAAVGRIAGSGAHAILLVEQHLRFALTLATHGYVLERGAIVVSGSSEELQREDIVSRYLAV